MAFLDNPITRISLSIVLALIFFPILLLILPVIPFPVEIGQGFAWFNNLLWQWDFIFPVQTFIYLFYLAIVLEIIFILFLVTMFIWNKISKR